MSKTQKALDLLAKNQKMTPCAAAKAANLAPSVLYRAIKSRLVGRCSVCGGIIRTPGDKR